LLVAQIAIITAILWMAHTNPVNGLAPMAMAAVMLGFSSATQDIVIDAYRIESAGQELQALMASSYIAGYRIGWLVSGAGALKLAAWFGEEGVYQYHAWQSAYLWMAAAMVVGVVTTLLISEPQQEQRESRYLNNLEDYLRFLTLFVVGVVVFVVLFANAGSVVEWLKRLFFGGQAGVLVAFLLECGRMFLSLIGAWLAARLAIYFGLARMEVLQETYIEPMADFFRRYGKLALLILLLVGFYRVSDIVLGVVSNVFYHDMGFTKDQIANISKTFGIVMTIIGGFLGGTLALRYGVIKILFLGALLSAATNLLFLLLAESGTDVWLLVWVIVADNLSAGLAGAAFVAYLSGLTNISFTAFQYAVFSSLMTLFPKVLGGYSGSIVDSIGYSNFFTLTALMGLPVLLLVYLVGRYIPAEKMER
jgi:PAT family beta-lactamase induction signal transducer AmpG